MKHRPLLSLGRLQMLIVHLPYLVFADFMVVILIDPTYEQVRLVLFKLCHFTH